MVVDPLHSDVTVEFDGQLYYFCSKGCKDQFESDPEHPSAAPFQRSMKTTASDVRGWHPRLLAERSNATRNTTIASTLVTK